MLKLECLVNMNRFWNMFMDLIGRSLKKIILGILIGYGFSSLAGFKFVIPWLAMFSAFTIAFIVAVIAGLLPAVKAAKLDPVESLRYE